MMARQRNAFKWRFAGVPMMAKKFYIFVYDENPFYRAHQLLYDTAYFLSHAQIIKLTKHTFLNSIRV